MPVFIRAHFQFSLCAVPVPGSSNGLADNLSCNNLSSFFLQVLATLGQQKVIPQPLLQLLVVPTTGLDITDLDDTVLKLFLAGLANSTELTYKSGTRRYIQFCIQIPTVTSFPVSEVSLTYFAAYLFKEGLSWEVQSRAIELPWGMLKSHWA